MPGGTGKKTKIAVVCEESKIKTAKDSEVLKKIKTKQDKGLLSDTYKYLQDYINYKLTGNRMQISLDDYLKSCAVIEACIESKNKRKTIDLTDYFKLI